MARKKNISKVAKARLVNPTATTREIAKKAGVDHTTVSRIDKELQQIAPKDDRIVGICDTDLENVRLGQKILYERLKNNPKDLSARDITGILAEGTKRYTIFMGDVTDDKGGLKHKLSEEDEQAINSLLANNL